MGRFTCAINQHDFGSARELKKLVCHEPLGSSGIHSFLRSSNICSFLYSLVLIFTIFPISLMAQLVDHCRGHGIESCLGLNFLRLNFTTA